MKSTRFASPNQIRPAIDLKRDSEPSADKTVRADFRLSPAFKLLIGDQSKWAMHLDEDKSYDFQNS